MERPTRGDPPVADQVPMRTEVRYVEVVGLEQRRIRVPPRGSEPCVMEDRARTVDPSHPGLFVHFRSEFPVRAGLGDLSPPLLGRADDDMNRSTDSGPSAVTLSDDEESARTLSESGAWRVPFPALGSSRQEELGQAIFADRTATEGSARRERVPHLEVRVEARGDRLRFSARVPTRLVETDGALGGRATVDFIPQAPPPVDLPVAHLRLPSTPKRRIAVTGKLPCEGLTGSVVGGYGKRTRELPCRGDRRGHRQTPGEWTIPQIAQSAIRGAGKDRPPVARGPVEWVGHSVRRWDGVGGRAEFDGRERRRSGPSRRGRQMWAARKWLKAGGTPLERVLR